MEVAGRHVLATLVVGVGGEDEQRRLVFEGATFEAGGRAFQVDAVRHGAGDERGSVSLSVQASQDD